MLHPKPMALNCPILSEPMPEINFRRNNPGFSWTVMLYVQNVTNGKNVFRKRFSYENGKIIQKTF